jgi:hypothetical protein
MKKKKKTQGAKEFAQIHHMLVRCLQETFQDVPDQQSSRISQSQTVSTDSSTDRGSVSRERTMSIEKDKITQLAQQAKDMRDTLKCLRYIFQLMSASRQVFAAVSSVNVGPVPSSDQDNFDAAILAVSFF